MSCPSLNSWRMAPDRFILLSTCMPIGHGCLPAVRFHGRLLKIKSVMPWHVMHSFGNRLFCIPCMSCFRYQPGTLWWLKGALLCFSDSSKNRKDNMFPAFRPFWPLFTMMIAVTLTKCLTLMSLNLRGPSCFRWAAQVPVCWSAWRVCCDFVPAGSWCCICQGCTIHDGTTAPWSREQTVWIWVDSCNGL